jgi:homoserine kinase
MLPTNYSKEDTILNIQSTALLVSAFAQGRGDLLATAMRDRIHQPYRIQACPLLGRLLPLSGTPGFLGVALSGAGPSVLMITDKPLPKLLATIREAAEDPDVEIVETTISGGAEYAVLD